LRSKGVQENRERLFGLLEDLYRRLENSLKTDSIPSVGEQGNPCGRCRECCTSDGLTFQNVTELEFEYIEDRVGPHRAQAFREFVKRDGGREVCPHFDEEIWGCGIYSHRPYSCRVFGHYRIRETELPNVCVFRGQEHLFEARSFYQEVPEADRLRELSRLFWPFWADEYGSKNQTAVGGPESGPLLRSGTSLHLGDPLDQALALQAQGDLQGALELLAQSDIEETPYALYCLSLILEGLGHYEDAARALEQALQDAPECGPIHFRRACNLLAVGRTEAATVALRQTVELTPDHVQALGLLGGQLLRDGLFKEAAEHLLEAVRLDPQNASLRRLLDLASSRS
jgi:tetratricopeptide (TPR) repeat protein